ncbi:MAG: zeta toxin family protein [Candidatus Pseudobacter hemicellulosilyticus]|uniref:Zeta toxin family protein n=1 Tax=Candidatus Pseudobacter hemicellulosilyticus TaxID=3121375 RepID=A0AAJ5WY95_9BACT|nr:MAG: zeta toxin family protein [Pseudobacter sp.]
MLIAFSCFVQISYISGAMPNLFIIAGCNGAGKTTASYTILPEILHCKEFVNADSIAAGLSPFNPESVAFEAGRIMLKRIDQLMEEGADFAFETTLATRSYVVLIRRAKEKGYRVTLLFFWLSSPEMALVRVEKRVKSGGHNIPADIVRRRYYRGIENLVKLYLPVCDNCLVVNNVKEYPEAIAKAEIGKDTVVINTDIWKTILTQSNVHKK